MVGPMESWKCHLSGGLHLQPKTTWWQQTAELGWVQLWPWTSYNKAGTVGQTAEIERPGISLWRQMWTLKLLLPGPTGHIISSYLSWSRFWPTPPHTHFQPLKDGFGCSTKLAIHLWDHVTPTVSDRVAWHQKLTNAKNRSTSSNVLQPNLDLETAEKARASAEHKWLPQIVQGTQLKKKKNTPMAMDLQLLTIFVLN